MTRTAIITGSSRGIGAAIARKLAAHDISVVVNYASQENTAQQVVESIKKNGGKAVAIKADVSKAKDVEELFAQAKKHFGSVDILINSAGLLINNKIEDVSEDEFDKQFNINVKGTFLTCRQAAKELNNNGRIINISTGVTRMMLPTYGVYAATKGAVEQLTRSLSKELGVRGITVNAVSPGPTNTELFREGKSPERIQQFAAMSAFNRLGEPDDIAGVVNMLVGEDAKWITGQNIVANGGVI